jgi:hypothetical protein
VALALICGAVVLRASRSSRDASVRASAHSTGALAVSCLAAYAAVLGGLGVTMYGYATALRFFVPFAVGLVPTLLGLAALHVKRRRAALVALALVPMLVFGVTFARHARQALRWGSILGFPFAATRDYLELNEAALSAGAREAIAQAQQAVPEGQPLVAWVNTPFWLDFRRNPIQDVDTVGLMPAWARLEGERYFIWEYKAFATRNPEAYAAMMQHPGPAIRLEGARGLALAQVFGQLAKSARVLRDDGHIVVFQLTARETASADSRSLRF